MGDFAPKLAEITDNVLRGDIWERPQLSKRDRSPVTVAALIALNRPDQLRSHFRIARQNGVTQEELIETITHLAFYAGWPNAVTAVGVAKEVFEQKEKESRSGELGDDLAGGLRRGKAAALDELQAAEADHVGTRITVAAEAADAYVQVREFQARIAVAQQLIDTDAQAS
jgi:alkylhydroperoxidase/carboxymuconolactone decarboxylase family protein YurZ